MAETRAEQGQERTILIAEDEPALAYAIAETLDLQGLETVVVSDGAAALEMARRLRPALILLDVTMPAMTGLEVCDRLKADPETAGIPVVFVTALGQRADRLRGYAVGAAAYLVKPFSPTELIGVVERALSGKSIEPPLRQADPAAMPADQLAVYARELKELFEQEHRERQALETLRQRLEELDRLKAGFLGAVTHELLTPFANIGLPLQILQRQIDQFSPDQQETLDSLSSEISQLHRLINGVVKFAALVNKQREPQPGLVALDRVIAPALQPVAMLAQARAIDFRVWVPDGLPRAYADPELLGEAVFQMAHNAVKFNHPEGRALIQARVSGDLIVIQVTDTGMGLTPEQMAILGQPFEQSADALRRGQEGLGIGWAFVCYVAQVHGGSTHVTSPGRGRGSTFALALPLPEVTGHG
jgi:signal transduction histidine kinase